MRTSHFLVLNGMGGTISTHALWTAVDPTNMGTLLTAAEVAGHGENGCKLVTHNVDVLSGDASWARGRGSKGARVGPLS